MAMTRPTSCCQPRPSRFPSGRASATAVCSRALDPADMPRVTATPSRCVRRSLSLHRLDAERKRDAERRSYARRTFDVDRPAERLDAVGQAYEARAARRIGAADAVVANRQPQAAIVRRERNL